MLSFTQKIIKNRISTLSIFLVTLLAGFVVGAQPLFSSSNENPITFPKLLSAEQLSLENGLSQSYVYSIAEDKNGFIWLATGDGINKYDGKQFTYYRNDSHNPNSLASNQVYILYKDSHDVIWAGTENGLSRYVAEQDHFINYYAGTNIDSLVDNNIWSIYEDSKQTLWVATDLGLHRFNREENSFVRVKLRNLSDNSQLDTTQISKIFQDVKGNYWLMNVDGVFHIISKNFAPDTALKNKINSLSSSNEFKVYNIKLTQVEDGYWLTTSEGIFLLDLNFNLKEHFTQTMVSASGEVAKEINISNDTLVWFSSDETLFSINPRTYKVVQHQIEHNNEKSKSGTQIYSLYTDQHQNLWVATTQGAKVIKHSKNTISNSGKNFEFLNNIVNAIVSFDNALWFVLDNQLYRQATGEKPELIHEFNPSVVHLLKTDDRLLIFQALNTVQSELFSWSPTTQSIDLIEPWGKLADFNVWKKPYIYENSIIYITNKGALAEFNIDGSVTSVTDKIEDPVVAINIDSALNIWALNEKGDLFQFYKQHGSLNKVNVINNTGFELDKANSITVTDNLILLGSEKQGLLVVDRKNKRATHLNEQSLLSNNYISDVVIDDTQRAWVSTNKGINLIDSTGKLMRRFHREFGLASTEFISQSGSLDPHNNVVFGAISGYYSFAPEKLMREAQSISPPVLTKLLISNKKVPTTRKEGTQEFTLQRDINSTPSVTLKYFQSPFSFEFISPNAKFSDQVAYRYRLKAGGETPPWLETDIDNLRATYTNISAGSYIFELEAYDKYDPSIRASKQIQVNILSPWWSSNSAILIYSLVALLILAYLLQQFRHKRLYHLQIKASEERLKLSLWGSGDEMWDWNIKSGKIYRSNIWGVLEFPQDGKRNLGNEGNNETNVNKADIARISEALQQHFEEKTEHFESTYRVKDKNGRWIWVLDRGKVVERDEKNRPVRMTGTLKDISQIKKADERLKLFAKCFENISDAVVIYDRQFNVVDVNKAFQRITGKSKKVMIGTQLTFRQYPDNFTANVKQHLLTKGGWHGEIESRRENGEFYLTDLNIDIIRDENRAISHFVGVFSDITKRKETEAELRKLANTDTLTGLPNRSYFQTHQQRLVEQKVPHALLVFDLDNFKKVNDSMGHEVGDNLLCQVANRIKTIGRKSDTVYRLGGDEFALVVDDTNDIHTITSIAKEILRTIAQPLKLKNHEIVLYSSIGIVLYPEDGSSSQELLKNADTAMYHAKHSGGNRYKFFNGSMNEQAVKRLQIEGLIRHGLKEDYFSVFYQPKIEISTGKVAGMEALVRFETPSKGIISPVVFIPVSEETGQIIDIGEIVLRKACYATKKWIDEGMFNGRCAVNLSAVQFTQPNLVEMISGILKETGLSAANLELEITEGTVMDSPQQAIDTMLQIRKMGIHLSLDDFGTGYSSLAYLKKFPLNTLKIDKAFVDDIEISEQGRNMVATIVTIAHNLGLQVVAEGVESNQQLSFLSGLRCEQLQGYLYSKPLAEKDFSSYLLSHQITDKSTTFNRYN